jgi:RNA recognition motif-containing protein
VFSGVTTEFGRDAQINNLDDLEDFDLFGSGGGMELEGDVARGNSGLLRGVSNGQGDSNGSIVVGHPSRTLFVRNINSNVEVSELKALFEVHIILHSAVIYLTFAPASPSSLSCMSSDICVLFCQQYGDIRTLYTACKHRGFVMISYYDIRAARNAMSALQNKPLKHRNLDIHYSIPKVRQYYIFILNLWA